MRSVALERPAHLLAYSVTSTRTTLPAARPPVTERWPASSRRAGSSLTKFWVREVSAAFMGSEVLMPRFAAVGHVVVASAQPAPQERPNTERGM